jgi:hypothetical protein
MRSRLSSAMMRATTAEVCLLFGNNEDKRQTLGGKLVFISKLQHFPIFFGVMTGEHKHAQHQNLLQAVST